MLSSENVPASGAEDKDLAEMREAVHDPKEKPKKFGFRHNGAKSSKPDARKMSQELNIVPNSMLSSKKVVAQPPTGPPYPPTHRSHPCELYDNINRVVALGHVIHSDSKMIHGKKMRDDCLRVSVDFVEIKTAILPCPSGDFVTVYDARESIVQWPKHLVQKKCTEAVVAIEVELHRNVFGQTVDVPIQMALEDIEFVCTSQKLTNNAIVLFIRLSRKYIFIPCNTVSGRCITLFISNLDILIHWVLIVFFDGVFYYLNSLDEKCRYKLEEQMSTVSKALRKLGVKRSNEKVFWVDVKHNPKQKGDWECGFFVLLYMKHIIESHDTSMRNPKEMFKSGMNYGASEIDEIKREWMDYISPILEKY
ncbi:hypothetical protein MKW92_007539 [Papaver armeniacum]|nr:hypothetical protein MKW92_007539 [Papaver armeniacum]